MPFVVLLEVAVGVLFFYLGTTQLVLPLWRGTQILPLFRRRRQLEVALRDAREHVDEAKLEQEVSQTEGQAAKIRKSRRGPGSGSNDAVAAPEEQNRDVTASKTKKEERRNE